ncbi:MAG: hypothetical protein R3298_10435 [Gammaproteobacteria bacterium]|nr:hypothetical protein [Gammaproteobacteria bacterium]
MAEDLGRAERHAWLRRLGRRHPLRVWSARLARGLGQLVPARRRSRALLRATLIHL